MFIEDTYRVKGFVSLEGSTVLVDCVGAKLQVTPFEEEVPGGNVLVAMAGAGMMMERSLRKAVQWYPELVGKVGWENFQEG